MKDFVPGTPEKDKTPNIKELAGKTFVIKSYRLKTGTDYLQAYVMTDIGEYRTSSEVIIKQLERMKPDLDKGETVRAGFEKVKKYYTFVPPK